MSEIKKQLTVATHGVSATVEAMQTASGIKDPIAQRWVNILITKSRILREQYITNPLTQDRRFKAPALTKQARQEIREDVERRIEGELLEWLAQQPPHRYAKIPEDSGEWSNSVQSYMTTYSSSNSFATSDSPWRSFQQVTYH